jgi:hypothetical protein
MIKRDTRTVKVYQNGLLIEQTEVDLPAVRSIAGFLNGEWNLDIYADCFDGNNRLGDIDASIEIGGHLLLIEFKRDKTALNKGQILKAIRTAKYCKTTTVFVFGETNEPKELIAFTEENPYGEGFQKTSVEDLKRRLRNWYKRAIYKSRVSDEDLKAEWEAVDKIMKEAQAE